MDPIFSPRFPITPVSYTHLWYNLLTDIDERKKVEEELHRSRAYLTEAQRLSLTGSFGCNLSTGEMFWSEETFRIYGYDRSTQPAVQRVLELSLIHI